MILSHRALTSLNMSSYRAIWTHFGPIFIFVEPKISDLGPKILILVPKISDPGPKILILVPKNIRSWSQNPDPGPKNIISWVHQIVFTGGLPPPRPPAVPGGLPAPQTPWRGACSPPCPPAYREAPPLGLSVDLGTKILARPGMARHGNIWHGTDHKGTARKSAASRQGRNGRVFNKARNIGICRI